MSVGQEADAPNAPIFKGQRSCKLTVKKRFLLKNTYISYFFAKICTFHKKTRKIS